MTTRDERDDKAYLTEWRTRAAAYRPPPDEWDRKAHAVIDHRDKVAKSVDGPVPLFGSAEWAAADDRTKAASQARHERAAAAAQGKAVSDRMAAESARETPLLSREDYPGGRYYRVPEHVFAEHSDIQRRRWPPTGDREQWVRYGPAGPPKVPEQRSDSDDTKERLQQARTEAAVARAREACQPRPARWRDAGKAADRSDARVRAL